MCEIVDEAVRVGEVLITHKGEPVARIVPIAPAGPRRPGSARGAFQMADDFDTMPAELEEYF